MTKKVYIHIHSLRWEQTIINVFLSDFPPRNTVKLGTVSPTFSRFRPLLSYLSITTPVLSFRDQYSLFQHGQAIISGNCLFKYWSNRGKFCKICKILQFATNCVCSSLFSQVDYTGRIDLNFKQDTQCVPANNYNLFYFKLTFKIQFKFCSLFTKQVSE